MGKGIWKIGVGIGVLGGIAGMVAGIIVEPIAGSIISAMFIGVFGVIWFKLLRPIFKTEKLRETGTPANARIIRVWDTGVTVNNNPQVGLEVEVAAPGMAPWRAETKAVISRLEPHLYQPGTTIAVRYDPNDPDKIAVVGPQGDPSALGTTEEIKITLNKIQEFNDTLNRTGELASAIVKEFVPMGVNVNGQNPAATLKVKVLPEGDDPFDAALQGVFGQENLYKYQPGQEIQVKYDKWAKEMVTVAYE